MNDSSLNIKRPFRELAADNEIISNSEDHREMITDHHLDSSSAKVDEKPEESDQIIVEQGP